METSVQPLSFIRNKKYGKNIATLYPSGEMETPTSTSMLPSTISQPDDIAYLITRFGLNQQDIDIALHYLTTDSWTPHKRADCHNILEERIFAFLHVCCGPKNSRNRAIAFLKKYIDNHIKRSDMHRDTQDVKSVLASNEERLAYLERLSSLRKIMHEKTDERSWDILQEWLNGTSSHNIYFVSCTNKQKKRLSLRSDSAEAQNQGWEVLLNAHKYDKKFQDIIADRFFLLSTAAFDQSCR